MPHFEANIYWCKFTIDAIVHWTFKGGLVLLLTLSNRCVEKSTVNLRKLPSKRLLLSKRSKIYFRSSFKNSFECIRSFNKLC